MSLVAPHFVGKKRDIFAYISLLLDVSTFHDYRYAAATVWDVG
jgi:hypothetical protein